MEIPNNPDLKFAAVNGLHSLEPQPDHASQSFQQLERQRFEAQNQAQNPQSPHHENWIQS